MNKKIRLFYDKIQCIYNIVCKKDLDKFTNLFYIKSKKASFENRKSYLSKKWLKKQDRPIKPRMFKSEYIHYPFNNLTFNGRRLFDSAEEFLEIDIEPFCKRIKNYVNSQIELEVEMENKYPYLYVYNINGVGDNPNIDYYYIDYCDVITPNEIAIKVKPPKHKSSLHIEPYHGAIKYQQSKIILSFENGSDYISAIFNTDLINKYSKYLIGVGFGIADINQKIPVAKKVILSKREIENIYAIYPILNETEIISAEENSYELKNNKDYNLIHLEKYTRKISRLNSLFTKLSQEGYFSSFYKRLALKELSAIDRLFQKFRRNQSFFTHYRKRILNILIDSYGSEPYKKLSIVMPIYNEENIFEEQSNRDIELQNRLKELSSIVDIEIIFVIKDCNQNFKNEFKTFLKEVSSLIEIRFVLKERIEDEVDSIDFILTDRDDFIVTRLLRRDTTLFQLYKNRNIIDNYRAFFRKIAVRAIKYSKFITYRDKICAKTNPLLKNLSGRWYHYIYGSREFLKDEIHIFDNGKVNYYSKDKKIEEGEIIIKEYESIMLLNDNKTKRVVTIVFDNQPYKIQKAFYTKVIAKQLESDLYICSIGILSRKPIPLNIAMEILGDIDNVRLLEKAEMSKRLSNYLIEEYNL